MTQLVIPAPDVFGGRVTSRTPLAVVVAALRRENPRAPFAQLKRVAESLRQNGHPDAAQISRDRMPDRFDSGADSGAVPSAVVDADARAPESEVGEAAEERKPTRGEIQAWNATLPKRDQFVISKQGRIPAAILVAYREAYREEVLASMVPVEGGAPMPAETPSTEVH